MPGEMLLVEDDDRFAQVVTMLLEEEMFRVRRACSAREARSLLTADAAFGLALVDLALPDSNGVEIVRHLASREKPIPALVLTGVRAHSSVVDALRAGASGYLYKHEIARRLIASIDDVFAGGVPLSAEAAKALIASVREAAASPTPYRPEDDIDLTPRELDVLRALARGLTYEQIGATLDISANTVRTHVRRLYQKLDACSRTEALITAARAGLVRLD
jgi:DNA-binding NarL/FixJ family response regulator